MKPAALLCSSMIAAAIASCAGDGSPADGPWAVERLTSPAAAGSAQARFAKDSAGRIVMSWLEPEQDAYALKYSVYEDGGWTPAMTVSRGDNWFVNWADLPSVFPVDGDHWIAHWLELKPENPYAYDIVYALSADGGRSWSAASVLNADETIAEHGFLTFWPWDDDIGAIWLDGRIVGAMTIDELFASETVVGMSLRFARIALTGEVVDRGQIDELVCDCCQTDAAMTPNGPLIIYRDRSEQELRDIVTRRYDGGNWSEPLRVGADDWIIDGCPVNGPAMDVAGASVGAAWFTAPDNAARVRYASSQDGGRSFSEPVELDGSGSFGHVDVVLLEDSAAVVSWWRRGVNGGLDLVAGRITADHRVGDVRVIAHNDASAPIDVPQMQKSGAELVFAWTEFGDDPGIRTAAAPVW